MFGKRTVSEPAPGKPAPAREPANAPPRITPEPAPAACPALPEPVRAPAKAALPVTAEVINLPAILISGLVTWLLIRGVQESATVNAVVVVVKVAIILSRANGRVLSSTVRKIRTKRRVLVSRFVIPTKARAIHVRVLGHVG